MLEFFAVVRHGDYSGFNLNETGEAQMTALGEVLKPLITDPERLVIFHSMVTRASQSAAILADAVGGTLRGRAVLESHADKAPRLAETWELVEQAVRGGTRLVIVVTHLEYARELPMHAVEKLGLTVRCPYELQKGQAWLLDVKAKTARVAP
jgi:broad specificity phosphatase PhoE